MDNIFRIEVDTGNGGYGFTDTLPELLADVDMEYETKEVKKCLNGQRHQKMVTNMWVKMGKCIFLTWGKRYNEMRIYKERKYYE